MKNLPVDQRAAEIEKLRAEEARLEVETSHTRESLSGLKDIDAVLSLADAKLSLCIRLLETLSTGRAGTAAAELGREVTQKAHAALRLVESLVSENISEDQKGIVQANPLYARARERLQTFLVAGGGGFLEAAPSDARARRMLSRSLVSAVRRFTGAEDRYRPLDLDDYPPFVRKVLLLLFPVMVREDPEQPPYGIEEGEETLSTSRNMKMPLTQAIFYLENEVVPELEKGIASDPGNRRLQEELDRVREKVEAYRRLRFFPRSTPVLLENGFYTEGMTGYTVDGEMLVTVPIPVSIRSGTNLDRIMELVRMDVVRRIAGHGVSPEIDVEYRHLRSLESGTRGSSRTASMKLDAAWGFRVLKKDFPFVGRLTDKKRFEELVSDITARRGSAERWLEALLSAPDPGSLPR